MTSTNFGTYTRDVTSNPSPLHSLLGQIGQVGPSTAAWCEQCRTSTQASHSQAVSVTQTGAVAAFEWSHKTDRKTVVMLIFCDSEPDTANGEVEYCSSGPVVVGYPPQTHLLHLEWKFHGYHRKQSTLRFHCFPLPS